MAFMTPNSNFRVGICFYTYLVHINKFGMIKYGVTVVERHVSSKLEVAKSKAPNIV